MIEKPGTLTRLNSLFDDGAVTDLINGEKNTTKSEYHYHYDH